MEFTIEELADCLFELLGASHLLNGEKPDEFRKIISKLYFDIENEHTFVNEKLLDYLKKKEAEGCKIVLISNFYCRESFMKKLFEEKGILELFDRFFVSCDYNASKSDGTLYSVALKELGLNCSDVLMLGNSKRVDLIEAKKVGINARLVAKEDKRFYCRLSSDARFSKECADKSLEKIFKYHDNFHMTFDNYAFPLFDFIRTLYNNLKKENAENVFFLSREGQLLKTLFDDYIADKPYRPNTHYFYASRNSLYGAILKDFEKEDFKYVFLSKKEARLFDLLSTVGFGHDMIEKIFNETGIDDREIKFTYKRVGEMKQLLGKSATFMQYYEANRNEQKSGLNAYLNTFDVNFGGIKKMSVVDVGWKGTMQDFLFEFFGGRINISGYYVGYRGQFGNKSENNRKKGILWTNYPLRSTLTERAFHFRMMNYENVLRANHNSVQKYCSSSDPVVMNMDVDDAKIYDKFYCALQKSVRKKVSMLTKAENEKSISRESCAYYYAKMFAKVKPNDYKWLMDCQNTHYDFFAKVGNFANNKYRFKSFLRYKLGGIRFYLLLKNNNKMLDIII